MTTRTEMAREVAAAVVWLDLAQVQQLLRLGLAQQWTEAQTLFRRHVPDLSDALDLNARDWQEVLLEELEYRLVPGDGDDEDPDLVATREVPDLTRYARAV